MAGENRIAVNPYSTVINKLLEQTGDLIYLLWDQEYTTHK